MYELEYKVRADHTAAESHLQQLGATDTGVVTQRDTYFNAPHRDFAETDEALRIRIETHNDSSTASITYKGPLLETTAKTREERETTVGDPSEVTAILDHLGFEPVATVEKHRHRYRLDEFTITLDSVTDVGDFLELEAEADSTADLDALDQRASEVLNQLGSTPAEHISRSYLELVLAQQEESTTQP